jgi:hypothetical protein
VNAIFKLVLTFWRYEQAALQDCSKFVNRCRRLVYTDLLAAVTLKKMDKDQMKIMRRFKRKKNRDNPINIGRGELILSKYILLQWDGYLIGYTERSQLSTNFFLTDKGKEFVDSI